MLEVLFSESAAGSLKMAMSHHAVIGGCISIIGTHEDGSPFSAEETEHLQQEHEEQERRRWAQAVPLQGDTRDILPFPLWLSIGPIDEEGIGPLRETTLEQLLSIYPQGRQAAAEILASTRQRLATLLSRAAHEPVRLWVDHTPDAACGLRWVLDQLRPLGFENLDLQVVELPALAPHEGGGLVLCNLGELHPSEWGRLTQTARSLSADQAAALAVQWQQLKAQDAPLRAVLNGVLVSAAEDLYDPYLRRVLDDLKDTFQEAALIGRTLAQFPLGFGDAWLAMRVEQWIADGKLEALTKPDADSPAYHRTLRKTED